MSLDQYITPDESSLIDFHVEKFIPSMSEKEKKYATYLILASWAGFPIILDQTSKESPKIHEYLSALISLFSPDDLNKAISNNEEYVNLKYLVYYAANFYVNCGNYHDNTKFIPRLSKESLRELTPSSIQHLLNDCIDDMYSLECGTYKNISLGFSPNGITSYYSPRTITEEEVNKVVLNGEMDAFHLKKRGEGFKINIDKSKFENIKEAIKTLLIHLNYYKSTNKAKEGIEFFYDLVSMDEIFLEAQKMLLEKRRSIYPAVGAIVEVVDKEKGEYNLTSQVKGEKATVLDALHYSLKNIQAANQ